ncbi:hypothetical protein ABFS83_05G017700 [Erythranthe nasuta]
MSQPIEVYPNPVTKQPTNSPHTSGSFGPVFIVLAVIFVISAVACVLGRLCSRRRHRAKEAAHHHHHHQKAAKQSHGGGGLGPKEWESRQNPNLNMRDHGDVELGFDKKFKFPSAAKLGGNGRPPHHNGGRMPEVRFADNVK